MSGHPLREVLLFAFVWVGLLFPLRAVIRRDGPAAPVAGTAVRTTGTAWIRIQFSELPQQFAVLAADGQLLWTEPEPQLDMEQPVEWALDRAEQVLAYEIVWTKPGRRAVQWELALPVGGTVGDTIWLEAAEAKGRVWLQ